jgi:hypothetical protein
LGKYWSARITKDALFEIEKPTTKGIGVDNLPVHVQNSLILTGNDLGRLGNCKQLPSCEIISKLKNQHKLKHILELKNSKEKEREVHLMAKELLKKLKYEEALAVLCSL